MEGKPLFRRESEQARSTAWLGRIVLIRPISFSFLTACALGFAAALGIFFIAGEYTRKARVAGVLAPAQGVVRILAQQSGIIEAVHAREGGQIDRDAPLIVLGDGRASRNSEEIGAAVTTRLAERQNALLRQREHAMAAMRTEQAAFAQRAAGLARELEQLDAELTSQTKRVALSDQGLGRARSLEGIGFLSKSALDREHEAALDQQARLEAARRSRMALARELAAIEFETESARSRAHAQLAGIDMQRAAIEQERVERDLQYHAAIVAPASGMVATVLVERGQMVTPGMALATLIPANAVLEGHLFSPSRSIGFVRVGQEVLLRYLAYPHQKFGMHRATITAVSRNPMLPGELGFTPIDGTREPLYRIKVALDGQAIRAYGRLEPLQAGMQVEADILLDRRRLIEWIFEPLLSLAGRT
jgi:membrane fusion protein